MSEKKPSHNSTASLGQRPTSLTNTDKPVITYFAPFPVLPPEIRRMIWSGALPQHRVVEISTAARISTNGPVILLSVCRESRNVALKTYRLITLHKRCKPFYFDPQNDVFLMGDVENLASDLDLWEGNVAWNAFQRAVRVLAIDPRVFRRSLPERIRTDTGLSLMLSWAIRDFDDLQEFIIFTTPWDTGLAARIKGHLKEIAEDEKNEAGSTDDRVYVPVGSALSRVPIATCLTYECTDWETALQDMRRELSKYMA